MARTDLAYFAGLFDGEGCVVVHVNKSTNERRSPQHQLLCQVTMADSPVIQSLKDAFDGNVSIRRAKNPLHKTLYQWSVTANKAKVFLEAVQPFLRVKKYEAWLGLEFVEQKTNRVGNGYLAEEELALREGFKLALQTAKREGI